MSLEKRILAIEKRVETHVVPGTQLSRVLDWDKGLLWCLALGGLASPKTFFYDKTIEKCLKQAEEFFSLGPFSL
jgi:hypothetical protein